LREGDAAPLAVVQERLRAEDVLMNVDEQDR
jgi:hypothetical protein